MGMACDQETGKDKLIIALHNNMLQIMGVLVSMYKNREDKLCA